MLLRDYRPADFEPIWALDQECFPPGIAYSRAELRAFLTSEKAETIVVEREGRVLAFVLGRPRGKRDAHVITLDVAAAARRHGLAGARHEAGIPDRARRACPRCRCSTIESGAPLTLAIRRAGERGVRHLPVVDAGRLVGIVSES